MYAPPVIAAREAALLRHPDLRAAFPDGLPTYTLAESAQRTKYLVDLADALDPDDSPARYCDADAQRFIRATRFRCRIDFPYFAERFVVIDEEGHGLRPLYPLWESQKFVLVKLAQLEDDRVAEGHPDGLLLNVLKARQVGCSTLAEALVAHRVFTHPNLRALSGSDIDDQAGYLFRMVGRIYDHLPWFLKPTRLTYVKNREMSFGNGSFIKTAWGKSSRGALQSVTGAEGSKGHIGRGQSFSVVHISELATWDNPEQLDTALLPAIPVSPHALVIFESTAEHAGDWWHKHWQAAEEGTGRFSNVFIPWYAEPRKYSLPAPADWTPAPKTAEHAAKAERDSPRWVSGKVTLSRDQLFWYERTKGYYATKGEAHKFLKEFCADDQECFQYAGRSVFTLDQLEQIDSHARKGPNGAVGVPIDIWEVRPAMEVAALRRDTKAHLYDEEPPRLRDPRPPAPLSPRLPNVPAAPDAYPVPPGYGFHRVPLSDLGPNQRIPSLRAGVLAIWEHPRRRGNRRYLLAVDVADGLGAVSKEADYSVIDVIRFPTIDEPAEQVAQYVSNLVTPTDLAHVCDAIGRYYVDSDGIEALAAIETNNHGLSTQDFLQLHLGYTHFYIWEVADAAEAERRYTKRIGWLTTPRTRPMLLSAFHAAITTTDPITGLPDFILNSPITRGELRHFVIPPKPGMTLADATAALGQHDDGIMAAAIGYYVAYRLAGGEIEPVAERRRRKEATLAYHAAQGAARTRDYRNTDATTADQDAGAFDGDSDDDSRESPAAWAGAGDPRARDDGPEFWG